MDANHSDNSEAITVPVKLLRQVFDALPMNTVEGRMAKLALDEILSPPDTEFETGVTDSHR